MDRDISIMVMHMTFYHHYVSSNLVYPNYVILLINISDHHLMVRITVFQTECVGSIPTGRIYVVGYRRATYS